jgi:Effector-associated domain 1
MPFPPKLTGAQIGAFRDALSSAFDFNGLTQLTETRLDTDFATIAAHLDDKKMQTFKLVKWAMARDKGEELLNAALAENPHNPALLQFKASLGELPGAPRADELLNPLNFDLELAETACRDAIDAEPEPRLVLLVVRNADDQLLDSLEKRVKTILSTSPIVRKLALKPNVRQLDEALGVAASYLAMLKSSHVLCRLNATPAECPVGQFIGCVQERYAGRLDNYLLLFVNSSPEFAAPADVTELPPPVLKEAVFNGWARKVSNAMSLGLNAELANWLKERSRFETDYSLPLIHAALDSLREFLGTIPPPTVAEVKKWLAAK